MKYLITLFVAFALISCGSDDDLNSYALTVNIDNTTINSATISWNTPNEGSYLYRVVLNNEVVADGLHGNTYTFNDLTHNRNYNGTVFAINQNGNETFGNFNFKTVANTIKEGSLILFNQAQIDNFIYTKIIGNLIIDGAAVTDLSPLHILTEVTYDITIKNTSLTNLNGLQNLIKNDYGTKVEILNNNNLNTISSLGSFPVNVKELFIENNPSLTTLSNLPFSNTLENLRIKDSPIMDLSVFNSIEPHFVELDNIPVNGIEQFLVNINSVSFLILRNIQTNDLTFLSQTNFLGIPSIYIHNIPLSDLTALSSFSEFYELELIGIPNITSLAGLTNMERVYRLVIRNNPQLTSLDGLDSFDGTNNFNTIQLFINDNISLTNFCAVSDYLNVTPYYDYGNGVPFYYVSGNAYNPDKDEIKTPQGCSQ